jgi:hypothetical protein
MPFCPPKGLLPAGIEKLTEISFRYDHDHIETGCPALLLAQKNVC